MAIYSGSTNLDPGDTDTTVDVYVKDLVTGDITLASTSDQGINANGDSGYAILSADGTKVAFQSSATNLDPADTDTATDAYVKDLVTGDLVLASVSKTGVKANHRTQPGALSPNGRRVLLFSAATNLSRRDTDRVEDVYLKNLTTGAMTLVSTSDTGVKGNGTSFPMALADGKVLFTSQAMNLDPADTEPNRDAYVKDLVTGDLTLVSAPDPSLPESGGGAGGGTLSANGTLASFYTYANDLDAADRDHKADVWVRDLTTGTLTLVSASAQGIKGNDNSLVSFISADGSTVAFESGATNLDPADTDSIQDIYVKTIA